jgi:hypothetical protein
MNTTCSGVHGMLTGNLIIAVVALRRITNIDLARALREE